MRQKKQFFGVILIFCFVAFGVIETEARDYYIEELVPDQVISVYASSVDKSGQWGKVNSVDPTIYLERGIKKVGERYNIKSGFPINKKYINGSFTGSIILFVEPKDQE